MFFSVLFEREKNVRLHSSFKFGRRDVFDSGHLFG